MLGLLLRKFQLDIVRFDFPNPLETLWKYLEYKLAIENTKWEKFESIYLFHKDFEQGLRNLAIRLF